MEKSSSNSLRVNWFSSSTASLSDSFTKMLLPDLSRVFDLKKWTSFDSADSWSQVNQADLNVFVLDPHEIWIQALSQKSPGLIVVLSADTPEPLSLESKLFDLYRSQVFQKHGLHGVHTIETQPKELYQKFLLPRFGLEKALGLLSPSQQLVNEVKEWESYPADVLAYPVRLLPETVSRIQFSSRKGFVGSSSGGATKLRIGLLGTEKESNLAEELRKIFPESSILELSPDILEVPSHLDVFINLQVPSCGHFSLPTLQAMSHGSLCIVPKKGWFSGISSSGVVFVDTQNLERDISDILRKVSEDSGIFRGKAGEALEFLLENHSPQRTVQQFTHAVSRLSAQRGKYALNEVRTRAARALFPCIEDTYGFLNKT